MNNPDSGYAFTLDKQVFMSSQRYINDGFLRQLCSISDDKLIFLDIEGRDEPLTPQDEVDLARDEVETFYTLPKKPLYQLRINKKQYEWNDRYISNEQIRQLSHLQQEESLFMSIQGDDEEIKSNQQIDLGRLGVEEFYSLLVKPEGTVILTIETAKGKWVKQPFNENLLISQLIQQIITKFQFAPDGKYLLKLKGGDSLEPQQTIKALNLTDGDVLCFTDLGKGA